MAPIAPRRYRLKLSCGISRDLIEKALKLINGCLASALLEERSDGNSGLRSRSLTQQRYRASGLTLLTAAIVLWNTVYLKRATDALGKQAPLDEVLL